MGEAKPAFSVVTNFETPSRAVVRFYNKRGTAEAVYQGGQAEQRSRDKMHGFETKQHLASKSVCGGDIRCLECCQTEVRGGNLQNGCRFAMLRTELRWQLLFNGAKRGTSVYNPLRFSKAKWNSD
jgi:hypothetical protein